MDHQVEQCLSCGHGLGLGRFCVNCGQVKSEPDSEEPPRRPPVSPPPVYEAPPPARYPLFADESGPGSAAEIPAATPQTPGLAETIVEMAVPPAAHEPVVPSSVRPLSARPPSTHRRRPISAGWIASGLAAMLLLGAGGWTLLRGSDSEPDLPARAGPAPGPSTPTTDPDAPETDDSGQDDQTNPLDLTRLASASPPSTASPSRDVQGNAVRYEAFNMLDGQPDTAWRMAGDASGQEVVFQLDGPTRITQVGLLNGYAKVEPGYDGYAANRRITSVEWVFADGTVVPQTLAEDLAVQSIPLSDVVSDTVTLRILTVSEPAAGPAGRDYTAISDVSLVGSPA